MLNQLKNIASRLFAGRSSSKAGHDWLKKRMIMVSILKKRMSTMHELNEAIHLSSYARLAKIESAIQERLIVRNSLLIVGIFRGIKLYAKGGYKFFSGYKSMIADFSRR
jgi:hypothetical protein